MTADPSAARLRLEALRAAAQAQLELVPPQEVPPLVEPQLAEPPLVKTEEQEAPLANLQLPQVLQVPHPLSQVMLPANLLPQVEMRKETLLL